MGLCAAEVSRQAHGSEVDRVPCLKVVGDNHSLIGGGRPPRPALPAKVLAAEDIPLPKVIQSLFAGLVGLAIVIAYVTHTECSRYARATAMNRARIMTTLHSQLIAVTVADFLNAPQLTPSSSPSKRRRRSQHMPLTNDARRGDGSAEVPAQPV